MIKKEYMVYYGFIGIGQFGGNVTKKFEEEGYPCVVFNSSEEDLATRNARNKFHFRNGQGCHKDRKKSKKLLKENLKAAVDEVRAKMPAVTTIFVCASAAGGTGSGMLAAMAKILSEQLGVNICIVTVLPDSSENFQSFANTVELFRELEQVTVGAIFILDNGRWRNKMEINDIFFNHLNTVLANKNGGDYGCLDRSEIDKLLSTPGMALISMAGPTKKDKLVPMLTGSNIYTPMEKNRFVKYVGLISTDEKVDKDTLYSEIGTPIDTYIGTNAPINICMVTGLTLPKTRLNEIKDAAKTNMEIIQRGMETSNDSLFEDDSMDFLDAFREPKQKPKKTTEKLGIDLLNEFL